MDDAPQFDAISVLIPGYSLEDLPADLTESQATGLLNAIAVAWHPLVISRSRGIPTCRQAESSELPRERQIVFVPPVSEDWLGHDWQASLAESGAWVLSGCCDRAEWLAAVEGGESSERVPDPDLVADFLALGTCHLVVLLLSRRLHHYVEPNQHVLSSEVQAAATAVLNGANEVARLHLTRAFECLLNAREQYHPMDCFLLDICLPSTETTAGDLGRLLDDSLPLNLCCSVGELLKYVDDGVWEGDPRRWTAEPRVREGEAPAEPRVPNNARCGSGSAGASPSQSDGSPSVSDPAATGSESGRTFRDALRTSLDEGRACLMTGHRHELRTGLGSLATLYDDLRFGQIQLQQAVGHLPQHWARRRFGMTHSLPAVLVLFGFESALHVALDDGIYPDRERGQMLWQGPDGSQIVASSRIPVAIDSSSTFLRLADRYAESMQGDNTAGLLLARLPDVQTPWLNDLRRIEKYAPVLGRFTTFDDFMTGSSSGANSVQFSAGEYLGPALIQSSVLKTEAPISSPATLFTARAKLEQIAAVSAMTAVLQPKTHQPDSRIDALAAAIMQEEASRADAAVTRSFDDQSQAMDDLVTRLNEFGEVAAQEMVRRIPQTGGGVRGIVILNPLPFGRQFTLTWPPDASESAAARREPRAPEDRAPMQLPASSDICEEAFEQGGRTILNLRLPAGGFAWLTESSDASRRITPQAVNKTGALAADYLLRNRFFEVVMNESTGGIAEVRFHGKRGNRMSQQVGFRYENGRLVDVDGEQLKVSYATSRMTSSTVTESGPWFGAIQTLSELTDPATGDLLSRVKQTTTVERSVPRIQIDIEFEDLQHEATGNPWMTYYGCRFAWDNEAASITRGVLGQASGFRSERFESPDYVEVADPDQRLLIVPHGRPYHRRTGPRMLDSLLIVEGEPSRRFRFTIEFDQPFPMRTVSELLQPPLCIETDGAVPKSADSGWLLGLTAKNVTLARVRSEAGGSPGVRIVLLLEETEGQSASCGIRTLRKVTSARLRRPDGCEIRELPVTEDGVVVEFSAFQIREVELTF